MKRAPAWKVSVEPSKSKEALAWFRSKTPLTREAFDILSARKKREAFTIAHTTQLRVVSHVWKSLDAAIERGDSLEDWKKTLDERCGAFTEAHLDTVFRTNVQGAYAAGRHEQAMDPDVLASHPFQRFDAILDDATTPECEACHGTTLPVDSPWWATHTPPLHFNCRSGIIPLSRARAASSGVTGKPPTVDVDGGFGLTPSAREWKPDLADVPSPLRTAYKDQ